ncbi:SDR family NAD(P)-dependent oxidoreductase [Acinetobacter zhairhuonensis]|uniref:SDR family NAD(P)-dependent oxidoreductase n=1 Tax=Acinetobacter sp. A7.4 TaxID=2919921 RepID=UPI001F4FD0D1|nr:SDR family oxidoreductase [Acinetobacter sp. A7.4]MCJ8162652.1 SDR family oxidoreductase [Acinetobacter sp. A7.4]
METFNKNMFQNKVAVVTGGTSGIGHAVAIAFAEKGAKVWALGLQAHQAVYPEGLDIHPVEIDVTDKKAVDQFFSTLDHIDSLFNGAGMGALDEHEFDSFKRVMDVNLNSVFYISECAAKLMTKSDNASIVNVSSMYAIFGSPMVPAYSASKGAIDQLTKSHALYFAKDKIRVNAIVPGWIDTPLLHPLKDMPDIQNRIAERTPMLRLGKPQEVADLVVYLSSKAASFISGTMVNIDGGYSSN